MASCEISGAGTTSGYAQSAACVVRAAGWNYAANAIKLAAALGTTMFYARKLAPEEFGLLAMAQVSIRLGEVLADFGMGNAVVQRKNLTACDTNTALILSLLSAAGLYALVSAITPWLAVTLGEPRLVPVLRLLAVTVVFTAASTVLRGLLRRQMRFSALALVETGAQLGSHLAVGIPLVLLGYGVWGMIWAGIASAAATLAVLFVICRNQVGIGFSIESARGLYAYSSRITMISLVQVAGHISQPLLMAKTLGTGSVGFFTTSARLVALPIEGVTTALRTVLFPVFSASNNSADLRNRFLKSYFILASVIVVWCCFVFAAADSLILLVLGERWIAAVPIVRVLSFGSAFAYMGSIVSTLIDSSQDLHPKLMVDVCYLLLLLGSIVALHRQGMQAVISAYAALEALRWVLYGLISMPSLGVKASKWIGMHRALWPLLAAFAIMLVFRESVDAGTPAARVFTIFVCGMAGFAGLAAIAILRMGRQRMLSLLQAVRVSPVNAGGLLLDSLRYAAFAEV